jgi:hypothetical protein
LASVVAQKHRLKQTLLLPFILKWFLQHNQSTQQNHLNTTMMKKVLKLCDCQKTTTLRSLTLLTLKLVFSFRRK